MGYCTKLLVERILAQALTGSSPETPNFPTDLINIGNTLNSNVIPDSVVDQYISWGDDEINSQLNEMYTTPICEIADFEEELFANIDEYNPYVATEVACPFNIGDQVLLTNGTQEERHIISEIIDTVNRNVFATLEPIIYNFLAIDTRIVRIKYPDPIPLVSAMLAAARIYDKYFASQSDPNTSEYGKRLNKMATRDLNNILNGRTILHGVHRIGNRFFNSNLPAQYSLPKGQDGAKDMTDIN
jgi:hypothetical protein